jgi:hypothetical protein
VVQLVFTSIASIHTSVTRRRSRARGTHKKSIDRSIDLARKAGEQIDAQIPARRRLVVSSPLPSLPKPYTKSPPEIFSIFLKKATFSSHTRTTFSDQIKPKASHRRFGVSRAFSVFSVE